MQWGIAKTQVMEKCLFDQWYDGEAVSINNFTKKIFDAFLVADWGNRELIKKAWPEWFKDSSF